MTGFELNVSMMIGCGKTVQAVRGEERHLQERRCHGVHSRF